jgi:hypothetical protein
MSDATQGSAASVNADVAPGSSDGTYRIALRHPDEEHPNSATFSWRRTYSFNPDYHGDGYDPLVTARADLKVAKKEFPGHDVRVERLVDNGDGSHSWEVV